MIKNEQQLKITSSQLKKLEDSIEICQKQKNIMDENIFNSMITGITSQINSLKNEIKDFEELKLKQEPVTISNLEELPDAMIRARITKNLTQEQLARQVNLKTQQIQRYEQNDYQGINLQRAIEIAKVLGIKLANSEL